MIEQVTIPITTKEVTLSVTHAYDDTHAFVYVGGVLVYSHPLPDEISLRVGDIVEVTSGGQEGIYEVGMKGKLKSVHGSEEPYWYVDFGGMGNGEVSSTGNEEGKWYVLEKEMTLVKRG